MEEELLITSTIYLQRAGRMPNFWNKCNKIEIANLQPKQCDSGLLLPSDRVPQKGSTNKDIFLQNQSTVFMQLSKTLILILQRTSNTYSLLRERPNKVCKNDLKEKPPNGLGIQTHTSLFPSLKLNFPIKDKREITSSCMIGKLIKCDIE